MTYRPILLIFLFLLPIGAQSSDAECGNPFVNGVGPYDYTDPQARSHPSKIPIVEEAHFTAKVEQLIEGESDIDPAADLDYTLRAVPNHHRALNAISRYELKRGRIDSRWRSADCYFDRALRFSPNDPVVRMLLGMHYAIRDRHQEALEAYRIAEQRMPMAAELHYHMGLTLIELGQYDDAKAAAKKAYDNGYPLPGLRRKLEKLGHSF